MKKIRFLIRGESGAITAMTVIMMAAFIGILAVIIDLGHLHTVQNELRNAADDCALRGARGFYDDSLTGTQKTNPNPGPGTNGAIDKAAAAIGDNKSDNVKLVTLPTADIQVGIWYHKKSECPDPNNQLQPWVWPPAASEWGKHIGPAVSLPTQKADGYNAGPVGMTLGKIFGIGTVPVKVKATAALTGFGGPGPATPILPFGPMAPPPESGNFTGIFRNDVNDNAGWTNLQGVSPGENVNHTSTNDIFNLLDGTGTPDAGGDHPIVSINNQAGSAALGNPNKGMIAPNNRFGLTNDPLVTGSTDPNVYAPDSGHAANEYLMPVFDRTLLGGDPDKFNQAGIVGGVMVRLKEIGTPPLNYFIVEIVSGTYVAPGYGGGAFYGVLAPQHPVLVE
jgi:hypothetical protein